jgi:hypothetical protein
MSPAHHDANITATDSNKLTVAIDAHLFQTDVEATGDVVSTRDWSLSRLRRRDA